MPLSEPRLGFLSYIALCFSTRLYIVHQAFHHYIVKYKKQIRFKPNLTWFCGKCEGSV